jgi:hypothetical protein
MGFSIGPSSLGISDSFLNSLTPTTFSLKPKEAFSTPDISSRSIEIHLFIPMCSGNFCLALWEREAGKKERDLKGCSG